MAIYSGNCKPLRQIDRVTRNGAANFNESNKIIRKFWKRTERAMLMLKSFLLLLLTRKHSIHLTSLLIPPIISRSAFKSPIFFFLSCAQYYISLRDTDKSSGRGANIRRFSVRQTLRRRWNCCKMNSKVSFQVRTMHFFSTIYLNFQKFFQFGVVRYIICENNVGLTRSPRNIQALWQSRIF